jgi:hypothetical protein
VFVPPILALLSIFMVNSVDLKDLEIDSEWVVGGSPGMLRVYTTTLVCLHMRIKLSVPFVLGRTAVWFLCLFVDSITPSRRCGCSLAP